MPQSQKHDRRTTPVVRPPRHHNSLWFGIVNVSTFLIASFYLVTQSSYQLSFIPDHLQGRVNSITRRLITGSQPPSIALTGVLIQFIGPVATALAFFVPPVAAGSHRDPMLPSSLRAYYKKPGCQCTTVSFHLDWSCSPLIREMSHIFDPHHRQF